MFIGGGKRNTGRWRGGRETDTSFNQKEEMFLSRTLYHVYIERRTERDPISTIQDTSLT